MTIEPGDDVAPFRPHFLGVRHWAAGLVAQRLCPPVPKLNEVEGGVQNGGRIDAANGAANPNRPLASVVSAIGDVVAARARNRPISRKDGIVKELVAEGSFSLVYVDRKRKRRDGSRSDGGHIRDDFRFCLLFCAPNVAKAGNENENERFAHEDLQGRYRHAPADLNYCRGAETGCSALVVFFAGGTRRNSASTCPSSRKPSFVATARETSKIRPFA